MSPRSPSYARWQNYRFCKENQAISTFRCRRAASRPAEGDARTRTQSPGLELTAFCTRTEKCRFADPERIAPSRYSALLVLGICVPAPDYPFSGAHVSYVPREPVATTRSQSGRVPTGPKAGVNTDLKPRARCPCPNGCPAELAAEGLKGGRPVGGPAGGAVAVTSPARPGHVLPAMLTLPPWPRRHGAVARARPPGPVGC